MGHYVPHTDEEIERMLAFLGLATLDELFASIPDGLRLASGALDLAPGRSEFDVLADMERLAGANVPLVCFAGGGAYDHDVPAAVRRLAFRSEFVTAYTPYQPEVAQGVLQALFEYQSLVSRLSGLPVANASLYDGATGCTEAVNLAAATTGRRSVWVSAGLHPTWRQVVDTLAVGPGHELVTVPLAEGLTAWSVDAEHPAPAALLVQQPNHLGCLEDVAAARRVADQLGALLIVAYDPVAMGLLRTPGELGADVAVAEGQPFGTPLSFGGPYVGLFSVGADHVRRIPGRLVGETVDVDGRPAYVTTLRAREQDIRREKASSNICTNQTLIAVACAIQMSWLGRSGLRELALRCARGARYAFEAVTALDGVTPLAPAPFLREFAIRTPVAGATVVERMAEEGFLAGTPVDDPEGEPGAGLVVAVTERRTREEIDAYARTLEKVIR